MINVHELTLGKAFEVSVDKLKQLGVADPYSQTSLEAYRSGSLSSDERLYFTLWGSRELPAILFAPKQKIAAMQQPVDYAYFIVRGKVLGVHDDIVHRLGPGAVIGVAEATAHQPYSMDFVAVDNVEARKIDAKTIHKLMQQVPSELKSIMRTITMRTLGLAEIPESLK
jgi:CRP-like cAMP-binding protein